MATLAVLPSPECLSLRLIDPSFLGTQEGKQALVTPPRSGRIDKATCTRGRWGPSSPDKQKLKVLAMSWLARSTQARGAQVTCSVTTSAGPVLRLLGIPGAASPNREGDGGPKEDHGDPSSNAFVGLVGPQGRGKC